MMISDSLWIQAVDHRISTAFVLFFLLLLLGNGDRRPLFTLRAACSLLVLCAVSWVVRYIVETLLAGPVLQGIGYSFHLMTISFLFLACFAFCYRVTLSELTYTSILALTVFKLAWNIFKVFSSASDIAGISLWSHYSVAGAVVSYLVYTTVCFLACAIFRKATKGPLSDLPTRPVMFSAFFYMVCQMSLEYCGHVFTADAQAVFLYYFCAFMYTVINFSALILVAQRAYYRRDSENMQAFITNKMQYYQMSRDGITSLQMKCHDLKHQIAAIRSNLDKENFVKYLDQLEDSIIEYGTVIECGNEALNVVLTEKNILCSTSGVKFSYLIDGTLFSFLSEMEIYSLFGNALDNALESCSKVKDPAKRVISLKAVSKGDMVILHVENFYEDAPVMVGDMPVTTKVGSGHGFGLRSIQAIAQQHGGVASVQADDHIFKLNVLMRPDSPASPV